VGKTFSKLAYVITLGSREVILKPAEGTKEAGEL
jgi:hypothetical protein